MCGFFLFVAMAIPVVLRRSSFSAGQTRLLIGAILASVLIKVVIAPVGIHGDLEAYKVVSGLVEQGKSVYANTPLYNYGPVWAWILAGINRICTLIHWESGAGFQVILAAFLAMTDVLLGLVIARAYSCTAAIVFLLSPISMLVSGAALQFDNLALLVALLAWMLIRQGNPIFRRIILSGLLAGLSLIIKHDIFLFPIWLIFWRPLGKLRYRFLYLGIAYALFFSAFLPWLPDPSSRTGIVENVFRYSSNYGFSLVGRIVEFFLPISSIDSFFNWIPLFSAFKLLWMAIMLGVGFALARQGKHELFLGYLLALLAFTPSVFATYLIIALIPCSVYYKSWASWAFLLSGTAATMICAFTVKIQDIPWLLTRLHPLVLSGRSYSWGDILGQLGCPPLIFASQLCAVVLVVMIWRAIEFSETVLPMRTRMVRATALCAVGCFPWMLQVALKHRA